MRSKFFSIRMTRLRGYVYGGQARTTQINDGRATFSERAVAGSETHALPFSAWHTCDILAEI